MFISFFGLLGITFCFVILVVRPIVHTYLTYHGLTLRHIRKYNTTILFFLLYSVLESTIWMYQIVVNPYIIDEI